MKHDNFKAYIAWAAVSLSWGTTYLAIRIGVSHLPPLLFAGFRWIAAGLIFISFLKLKGQSFPGKKDLILLAVPGLLMLGIGNGLISVAEQWLPSGLTALFITTMPFWVVGFESLLPNGQKFNITILAGLLLGLSGIFIIFGNNVNQLLNPSYRLGIILILTVVISWSLGTVYSKYKTVKVHPLMGAAVQMLIAGSAQSVVGISLGELSAFHFNQSSLLAFTYLIFFGAILGYGSYIYAIANLPISFVATYAYINPVIALFLGWLVLNEELNLPIIAAAAIIFTGVAIVKRGAYLQKIKEAKSNILPGDKTN